jgi:hypothetical protein
MGKKVGSTTRRMELKTRHGLWRLLLCFIPLWCDLVDICVIFAINWYFVLIHMSCCFTNICHYMHVTWFLRTHMDAPPQILEQGYDSPEPRQLDAKHKKQTPPLFCRVPTLDGHRRTPSMPSKLEAKPSLLHAYSNDTWALTTPCWVSSHHARPPWWAPCRDW